MVRKALFRGTWYPYREDECRKIIGDIGKGGEAMHAVLPHAGWPYSAPMLREYFSIMRRDIKRIIILSPSHYYRIPADAFISSSFTAAETPFGEIPVTGVRIRSAALSDTAIQREHGVEMILPFIGMLGGISVSFLLINEITSPDALKHLASELIDAIDSHTSIIASSDFTHYGPRFGYMPYGIHGLEKAIEDDGECSMLLSENKTDEVFRRFTHGTICGIAAAMILSQVARETEMPGWCGMSGNSAESTGDDEDFVSYRTVYWRK